MRQVATRLASVVALGATIYAGIAVRHLQAAETPVATVTCMSDQQLKSFLADIVFWQFHNLGETCLTKAPELRASVIAARRSLDQKANPLRLQITEEVVGIFRPTYGDDAFRIRVEVLREASRTGLERAAQSWTPADCSTYVATLNQVAARITGSSIGADLERLVEANFATERQRVPPCPP